MRLSLSRYIHVNSHLQPTVMFTIITHPNTCNFLFPWQNLSSWWHNTVKKAAPNAVTLSAVVILLKVSTALPHNGCSQHGVCWRRFYSGWQIHRTVGYLSINWWCNAGVRRWRQQRSMGWRTEEEVMKIRGRGWGDEEQRKRMRWWRAEEEDEVMKSRGRGNEEQRKRMSWWRAEEEDELMKSRGRGRDNYDKL